MANIQQSQRVGQFCTSFPHESSHMEERANILKTTIVDKSSLNGCQKNGTNTALHVNFINIEYANVSIGSPPPFNDEPFLDKDCFLLG